MGDRIDRLARRQERRDAAARRNQRQPQVDVELDERFQFRLMVTHPDIPITGLTLQPTAPITIKTELGAEVTTTLRVVGITREEGVTR